MVGPVIHLTGKKDWTCRTCWLLCRSNWPSVAYVAFVAFCDLVSLSDPFCGITWPCIALSDLVWYFVALCGHVWSCVALCGLLYPFVDLC